MITAPPAPAEAKLAAWRSKVDDLMQLVEKWSADRNWGTLRDTRTVRDGGHGEYEMPVLLVHLPQGRLLLDPISWDITGADGRVDFCVIPSYDSWPIVRKNGRWQLFEEGNWDSPKDWTEPVFADAAIRLVKQR